MIEDLDLERRSVSKFYSKIDFSYFEKIQKCLCLIESRIDRANENRDQKSQKGNFGLIFGSAKSNYSAFYLSSQWQESLKKRPDQMLYVPLKDSHDSKRPNPTILFDKAPNEHNVYYCLIWNSLFGFVCTSSSLSIKISNLSLSGRKQGNVRTWVIGLLDLAEKVAQVSEVVEKWKGRLPQMNLFEVLQANESRDEFEGRVVDIDIRFRIELIEWVNYEEEELQTEKVGNLVLSFRLYFESSEIGLLECHYFEFPAIPKRVMQHALMGRENAVVEVLDDVYIDLKRNEIQVRDYGAELKDLYRMVSNVNADTVVEALIRLTSLGAGFSKLLRKMKVKDILVDLRLAGGWGTGIKYFQAQMAEQGILSG